MGAASYPSNTSAQTVGSLVVGAGNESDAHADADDVVVGDLAATATGITGLTSTAGTFSVVASDASGGRDGRLDYAHSGPQWEMYIGGAQEYLFTATQLKPAADGANDCGGSGRRWNTVYSEKYSLRTPSGFAGTARDDGTIALRSTDGSNSDTTVGTLDADGEHGKLIYHVVGMDEAGANVYSRYEVTSYYRTGGAVTQITAHAADTQTVGTVTGWAVFEQISGNNVLLRVRGAAGTDIRWSGWYTWQPGGTEAS